MNKSANLPPVTEIVMLVNHINKTLITVFCKVYEWSFIASYLIVCGEDSKIQFSVTDIMIMTVAHVL